MPAIERSKLLWRCRRGTREMDLLLSEFVNEHIQQLDEQQCQHFEAFLDEADLDIMNWITGKSEPARKEYVTFIQHMRELKNRHVEQN